MLAPGFEFTPDPILAKLLANERRESSEEEEYLDPRHCLVFWARPSQAVKDIIAEIQSQMRGLFPSMLNLTCPPYVESDVCPALWLMPIENLHTTILEIAHSLTEEEVEGLVKTVQPKAEEIVNFPRSHQATLVRPVLSLDAAALALSFVPSDASEDEYSYHHLRRDVYALAKASGVEVRSRYVVPSAHLTVGRWVDQTVKDEGRMEEFVRKVEEVNEGLKSKYWGENKFTWRVGEEKGLVCRRGRVWYGGGESLIEG